MKLKISNYATVNSFNETNYIYLSIENKAGWKVNATYLNKIIIYFR